MAPAATPNVQSPSVVPTSQRSRQNADSNLLRRMSRAESDVAIKLSHVSRARSVTIASAATPTHINVRIKTSGMLKDAAPS